MLSTHQMRTSLSTTSISVSVPWLNSTQDTDTMSKLFIKNPLHPDGVRRDILIEGNKIVAIGNLQGMETGAEVIDASHLAVIPGLINCHTHAAMTFFRGYGDDLLLMDWLNNMTVSYTHLTLPTILRSCRSRWSPYH